MAIGLHNASPAGLVVSVGIFLSFMASIASASDYGCHDVWEKPSADNDMMECVMAFARNNPGALMPPIIPAIFFLFVCIAYPIVFICRIYGGCGSNTQRPGADCYCDGEELDEVDEVEKSKLYSRRHVFFIKVLCLVVTLCSIVPIIITPIGFKYANDFWDSFYDQAETEIIVWAQTEKDILQKGLSTGNVTYNPLFEQSAFNGFDDIISLARDHLKTIDDLVGEFHRISSRFAVGVIWLPFFLLSFLLVFIVFNCRKIFPALFTFLYFIVIFIFCIISCCCMLLGVISVLTCGEVELHNQKLPGILQWYGVPWWEKNSFFPELQLKVAAVEGEKSLEGCTKLLEVCDDKPFDVTAIPTTNLLSLKPFNCSLKPSTVASVCTDVEILDEIMNSAGLKEGVPGDLVCTTNNCTIGTCSTDCKEELRPYGAEIREKIDLGKRIGNAIRRVSIDFDSDTFVTRLVKPMSQCGLLSKGCFLMGSGLLLGALLLGFGIILQFKGQKLFFPSPK